MADFGSTRKRCPDMVEAGIEDPDSLEGKRFCIEKCPYDRCIVFESEGGNVLNRRARVARAIELQSRGYSVEEIAREIGKDIRTIRRYLK